MKKYNAVCLIGTDKHISFIQTCISYIRSKQDSPIVVFVDEFDYHIESAESAWLTFLDGTDSLNGIIFIGCTNYLNKISDRIKHRKSRIKYLFEVDKFPIAIYEQYIQSKIPSISKPLLKEIAFKSEENKLTIDQLKHVLIDYKLDGVKLDKAIEDVKSIKNLVETDD